MQCSRQRLWFGNSGFSLNLIAASVLCLCLAMMCGCKVGPDFKRPQSQMPAGWLGAEATQGAANEQELISWWSKFDDPNLTSLIERAVKTNLDLRLAESRILQSRASLGIATSSLWPNANLSGSYTRSHSVSSTSAGRTTTNSNLYIAGLDSLWELDFFGGNRRGVEAAQADVEAAVRDKQSVMVTLASEVALNYINLRGYQQQIAIVQQNLKAQMHSADLTHQRFEGGFVSSLDVANANAQVASTSSQIPLLESSARQTIYNLSVLLGQEPAALLDELMPASKIPVVRLDGPTVPAGVPSDLLRRRPDIRRAEAQIHAATARIGVAASDLFPKLSLSGSASLQGSNASSLTKWKNLNWSLGPSASWQLFSGRQVQSNIELQKALKDESFITYQQTVLTALQEVENALVASTKEQEHRTALIEAVTNNRKAVELSTKLYTEGQTDFLNVLTAQGALYSSEDALVQSNRTVSTNLVALYKALGGGWQSD
jgi:NodT family efflux transporter outer membrane factor (OMF) lipoprotein